MKSGRKYYWAGKEKREVFLGSTNDSFVFDIKSEELSNYLWEYFDKKRNEMKLTRTNFARIVGVPIRRLQGSNKHKHRILAIELLRICLFFKMNIEDVLEGILEVMKKEKGEQI